MNRSILLALTLATLTACEDRSTPTSTTNPPPSSNPPKADNTARNKGDTEPANKTPLNQSNSAEDTRITADIRKAVVDDSGLSTNAQNCKIITEKGVVTLRGPVNSQAEKDAVEAKAKSVSGVVSVVNELEVKTS